MNYVMAAPIQAALADDPRVQFYATSSERRSDIERDLRAGAARHGADLAAARSAEAVRRLLDGRSAVGAPAPRHAPHPDVSRRRRKVQPRLRRAASRPCVAGTGSSSSTGAACRTSSAPERSTRRATRRGSSACPKSTVWSTGRCGATTSCLTLDLDPGATDDSLRADLVGGVIAEPDGSGARRGPAGAIVERDRQAARPLAGPAPVLFRRRRLARPPARA